MGLTNQSTGSSLLGNSIIIDRSSCCGSIIALSGNPNVGKSTVFNSLTGLNQHTGNWPGKTVTTCYGKYRHKNNNFILVDIPGTYSLMANSAEEEVARDFVCFENPDATVVVTDATCLERNLNLVLQTLEITKNVVVCVNLIDEAERKKIHINCKSCPSASACLLLLRTREVKWDWVSLSMQSITSHWDLKRQIRLKLHTMKLLSRQLSLFVR